MPLDDVQGLVAAGVLDAADQQHAAAAHALGEDLRVVAGDAHAGQHRHALVAGIEVRVLAEIGGVAPAFQPAVLAPQGGAAGAELGAVRAHHREILAQVGGLEIAKHAFGAGQVIIQRDDGLPVHEPTPVEAFRLFRDYWMGSLTCFLGLIFRRLVFRSRQARDAGFFGAQRFGDALGAPGRPFADVEFFPEDEALGHHQFLLHHGDDQQVALMARFRSRVDRPADRHTDDLDRVAVQFLFDGLLAFADFRRDADAAAFDRVLPNGKHLVVEGDRLLMLGRWPFHRHGRRPCDQKRK